MTNQKKEKEIKSFVLITKKRVRIVEKQIFLRLNLCILHYAKNRGYVHYISWARLCAKNSIQNGFSYVKIWKTSLEINEIKTLTLLISTTMCSEVTAKGLEVEITKPSILIHYNLCYGQSAYFFLLETKYHLKCLYFIRVTIPQSQISTQSSVGCPKLGNRLSRTHNQPSSVALQLLLVACPTRLHPNL